MYYVVHQAAGGIWHVLTAMVWHSFMQSRFQLLRKYVDSLDLPYVDW